MRDTDTKQKDEWKWDKNKRWIKSQTTMLLIKMDGLTQEQAADVARRLRLVKYPDWNEDETYNMRRRRR